MQNSFLLYKSHTHTLSLSLTLYTVLFLYTFESRWTVSIYCFYLTPFIYTYIDRYTCSSRAVNIKYWLRFHSVRLSQHNWIFNEDHFSQSIIWSLLVLDAVSGVEDLIHSSTCVSMRFPAPNHPSPKIYVLLKFGLIAVGITWPGI